MKQKDRLEVLSIVSGNLQMDEWNAQIAGDRIVEEESLEVRPILAVEDWYAFFVDVLI